MSKAKFAVGDVIESYQGMFAKVVEIKESRYGLSAWVYKREAAEVETIAVVFLNDFGISQVVKGGSEVESEEGEKPLEKMTVAELKAYAATLGVDPDGTKAVLTERITAHLEAAKTE